MITEVIKKLGQNIDNNNDVINRNLEKMEEIKYKIADDVLNDVCNIDDVAKLREEYKQLEFSINILCEENNVYKTEAIGILEKSVG